MTNICYNNFFYYGKYILYRLSLYKKLAQNYYDPNYYPWWNEIRDGIILGAIPLKNYYHDAILRDMNVKYVLTILDKFEYEMVTYVTEPVKPQDWSRVNISQKIINSQDFHPLTTEDIDEGVKFLENCVDDLKNNNNKIYVHCKSGHGRSVMIVVAYLMKRHNMTLPEAYQFTKDKRQAINLNQSQYDSLYNYYLSKDLFKKLKTVTYE